MKVLLVSEDGALTSVLSSVFREYGHDVLLGSSRFSTWRVLRGDVDVLLYELEHDDPAHWDKLSCWRQMAEMPMISLGPPPPEDCAVRALNLGSDDFMPRPLCLPELVARAEALIRRVRLSGWSSPTAIIPQEGAVLRDSQRQVVVAGRSVHLTPTEFRLLELLLDGKGEAVSYDELAEGVWGRDLAHVSASLKLYIWRLRRKLENDPLAPKLITTRRGAGYAFVEPD